MTDSETKQRVYSLVEGVAMVVTDLHGDWSLYCRYRDSFLNLNAQGRADYLILTGDLIHSEGPSDQDGSLDIVLDVMKLRRDLNGHVIYLLGNHEFPHLYAVTLQKGRHLYTPRFEAAMGEHRATIRAFFDSLPIYVRTRAGVALCHAGAFAQITEPGVAARLLSCSHQKIWREISSQLPMALRPSMRAGFAKLNDDAYDEMARRYLAVSGPSDPRYDDFLIGSVASSVHPDFRLLWAALFSRNEREYAANDYQVYLKTLLQELSQAFYDQRVMVTGHLACAGGYALVAHDCQLRLASGSHSHPLEEARYLLFDVKETVQSAVDLLSGLGSVFD
jgi:hypothetical protein